MSFDTSLVRITSTNKVALISEAKNMYASEGCGICEKKGGGEVFWFSPYSRTAHAKCDKMIEGAEETLDKIVEELFKHTRHGEKTSAYSRARKAVRIACGSETIRSFFEKNGVKALSNLYNTVGIEAAKKLPAKL